MGSSNFASQMLHLCSYNLVNIQILNQVQKFGGIKLHNPKGTTTFATLSHFVPFAEALSLPSSIFWAGNQCGIAAASYSLMMNMWRP